MYCPKCGAENADDARICRSCSAVMTNVAATGPAPGVKTSALAVTSLVLGILSFCTFFLTAPLAVIFGIIALVMIARSRGQLKGTGMAIAGIAVPVVMLPFMAILMGILLPALNQVKITAERSVCGAKMAVLGEAMLAYASDHDGAFPASSQWCDVLIEYAEVDKLMFRCAGTLEHGGRRICSYAMNENVEKEGANSPGDMVLLFETEAGWNQSGGPEILDTANHEGYGCNILFVDGRVQFVKNEDLDGLKWTAEPED